MKASDGNEKGEGKGCGLYTTSAFDQMYDQISYVLTWAGSTCMSQLLPQ